MLSVCQSNNYKVIQYLLFKQQKAVIFNLSNLLKHNNMSIRFINYFLYYLHAKQCMFLTSIIVPLLKENDVTSLPEDPTTKMIKEISSFPFFTSTTKSTTFLSSTSDVENPVKKLTVNGMEAESSTKLQGGIFYSIYYS